MEREQVVQDNNNFIPDDHSFSENRLDNQGSNDSNSNHGSDSNYNDGNVNHLGDSSPKDGPCDQTRLFRMLRALGSKGSDKGLIEPSCSDTYPKVVSMIIDKNLGASERIL